MLPIINRHINKRNGLVSTVFRTIQTSAHQQNPTATVLHWASSQDLDDQKKFQDHIKAVVENDTSRKRITQNDEIIKRIVEDEDIMKKLLQERAKRSRELKREVIKQMPYKEEFDQEVEEWRNRSEKRMEILATETKQQLAVFRWAQILSSLDAAIVLFLNTNINAEDYTIPSITWLEEKLTAAEGDEMVYKKMEFAINAIESVLGVSCKSLLLLIQQLNQLERNPAAHRALSRKDVKEATQILVAIDSNDLTPSRLFESHTKKNPHSCPILEEPERDTLKRMDRVYTEMLGKIPSFCIFFDLEEEEFEARYEGTSRYLKVTQTKLFAYWIDSTLRRKQMTKDLIEISMLAPEPSFFKDIKLPKGTQEDSEQ